jgi:hypothetical protein
MSSITKIMEEAPTTVGDACAPGIVPVTPAAGVTGEPRVVTPEDGVFFLVVSRHEKVRHRHNPCRSLLWKRKQ